MDPDHSLQVTAVDPPGEEDALGAKQTLQLVKGVCRLLILLETVEQFQALADDDSRKINHDWVTATSSSFDGLTVAIPKRYLDYELEVRWRLAVYLAASEVIADPKFSNNPDDLSSGVESKLSALAAQEGTGPGSASWLRDMLESLASDLHGDNFLYHCSLRLGLDSLSQELMHPNTRDTFYYVSRSGSWEVTSGGMYLQDASESMPSTDSDFGPSRDKG